MDISALLAALGTTAGKAAAGTAIAAASVGGLHAADVVDVPLLPDAANTTVVETLPADGETVSGNAGDLEAEDDTAVDAAETHDEEETDAGRQDADVRQDGESQGIGEAVSADAQDGGVEGEDVVAQTPAAERVPETPGSQADQAPGSQAPEQAPVPEGAGSQADERGSQAPDAEDDEDDEDDVDEAPAAQAEQEPGAQADGAQDRRGDS